jgi:hypothetical protein
LGSFIRPNRTFEVEAKCPASCPPEIGKGGVRGRGAPDLRAILGTEVVRIEDDIDAFRAGIVNDIINVAELAGAERTARDGLKAFQKKRQPDGRHAFRSEVVDFRVGGIGVVIIDPTRSVWIVLGS